ncbi:deoxyribose-phosphate aldolase-like [Plakobranchus ocellatus]|uniref:Deoxyribose-phosphate aldolase n=1 Tax=Plakobranchus ocellatus TaxID=259542 RepID=A0AAV4DHK7_9GAST|nr:deoxyribose-phosphate aldolase-like [Plakobranchus ocellatus]
MDVHGNPGRDYDETCFKDIKINLSAVKAKAAEVASRRSVKKQWQAAWQLRAVTCIDLTTLAGDDTPVNVSRLCAKAAHPVGKDIVKMLNMNEKEAGLTTGAVCVYPNQVKVAREALDKCGEVGRSIPVASVATGFPCGQTPLAPRLEEIRSAVRDGASEIDIVINRTYALAGNWKGVYDEVCQMKAACGNAHMKAILATGELGSLRNIYKASMVCMMAGADFIKTSTGKEGVNATLVVALVMVRSIRDYFALTGVKVGFKPAGGIRTAKDACVWLSLMKEELGEEWTKPNLFRIGASALLADIERQLYHYATGCYPALSQMPMG